MGAISKAIDKLPNWIQVLLCALGVCWLVYSTAHYGFGHTLLRLIFSPVI